MNPDDFSPAIPSGRENLWLRFAVELASSRVDAAIEADDEEVTLLRPVPRRRRAVTRFRW